MNEKTAEQLFEKAISITGLEMGLSTDTKTNKNLTSSQRFSSEEIFSTAKDAAPDAIYFSGDHPFIQFKQLSKFKPETVWELHSKIWNEGRSPIVAITTPSEIILYSGYHQPVESKNNIGQLEIDRFEDTEADLLRLKNCLSQEKIDSGKIWNEEVGSKIKTKNRVDKLLVQGLKEARERLWNNGKGLSLPVVHDLLGRSLFVLYLEDRGVLTKNGFPDSAPTGAEKFFDLLDHKKATYELFDKLKEKFNGDLFPVSSEERKSVTLEYLNEVKKCFYGFDHRTQMPLWKMFNFRFIPIELISSIYEEFMSGEEDGRLKVKEEGAYYTKPMLVDFMLNEVLPLPDENNKRYDYKILDSACGSGIFLVQSYRRLIARWKYANPKSILNEEVLENVLLNGIYGIDKNEDAIKVAAFSLYLTFLNYLQPEEIRAKYIEQKRRKFEPLVRWTNKKELKERSDAGKKPGNNLFQCNTFDKTDLSNIKFDIIIGNPPWKWGTPDDEVVSVYITENKLPAQIACAYLEYMPEFLSENGVIALVSTAKVLFNTSRVFEKFRQNFFRKFQVDTIINLAVVRDIMFHNATAPGAVIIYRHLAKNSKPEHLLYCVPKNIKTIDNEQSVVIDATEIKYLPLQEVQRDGTKIFKVAMWGGMRDYLLLKRLQEIPSIGAVFKNADQGIGLHAKGIHDETLNAKFEEYKLIPQDRVERFYTPNIGLNKLDRQYSKYRKQNEGIFNPPLILLKRGTSDSDICTSYIDYKCVFTDRIYGLSVKEKTPLYQKAVVACLNSKLAMYYLFLTSSTWSIDKAGDMLHAEILSFPAIAERMNDEALRTLEAKIDDIIRVKTDKKLVMNQKREIEKIEGEIDEIIYAQLHINTAQQAIINDVLSYSIGLHKRYEECGAELVADIEKHVKSYSTILAKTLTQTLKFNNRAAWVEIIDAGREETQMVAVHFDDTYSGGKAIVTENQTDKFKKLLKEINAFVYEQHSESVFYRKVFEYYKGETVYIVKPNERRFWSKSQALHDADALLVKLITANKKELVVN